MEHPKPLDQESQREGWGPSLKELGDAGHPQERAQRVWAMWSWEPWCGMRLRGQVWQGGGAGQKPVSGWPGPQGCGRAGTAWGRASHRWRGLFHRARRLVVSRCCRRKLSASQSRRATTPARHSAHSQPTTPLWAQPLRCHPALVTTCPTRNALGEPRGSRPPTGVQRGTLWPEGLILGAAFHVILLVTHSVACVHGSETHPTPKGAGACGRLLPATRTEQACGSGFHCSHQCNRVRAPRT